MSLSCQLRRMMALVVAVCLAVAFYGSPANAQTSPIETRYQSDPALQALLGTSTGQEYGVLSGRVHHYQNGSLFWTATTGVREVHGAIRARYFQIGGPTKFGWPLTDQLDVSIRDDWAPIGAENQFQGGTIAWSDDYGAVSMRPEVTVEWHENIYPFLYMPHHNEQTTDTRSVLDFGPNDIYWCSTCNGAHVVWAEQYGTELGIAQEWLADGGNTGFLGSPTGDLEYQFDDSGIAGVSQRFKGGIITRKGDPMGSEFEAHETHGAIFYRWKDEGGLPTLGYAISDEMAAPGGRVSHFEHGDVFWDSTTMTTSVIYS